LLVLRSIRNYAVFSETHTVYRPVDSIILLTRSCYKNYASTAIGTITTESEIQANCVI
jgi:hypothetical protein